MYLNQLCYSAVTIFIVLRFCLYFIFILIFYHVNLLLKYFTVLSKMYRSLFCSFLTCKTCNVF